ncbi:MAG: excisionase family DNA-binding protein [Planctomycetaceae bacterium]
MRPPLLTPAPRATDPAPLLWTRFQAAKRLNVSLRYLDALIADGRLRVTRIGRAVRITESALLDFIATCEQSA